jgi:toxin ParE1/3/4
VPVQYRRRAVSDLEALKAWGVDHWGADRTDDFLAALRVSIDRLDRFPYLGRQRPTLGPGLRSILQAGYLIFYTVEPEGPTIVRVLHHRRNHAALDFSEALEADL